MALDDRWFTVPVAQASSGGVTSNVPKYQDTSGIELSAGQIVTISGTDYFLVRFSGTTSALDTVEGKSDTTSIQESGLSKSDVETELNERTGHNYSFTEWEKRFFTS